jgi:hypothetical protein
MNTTTDYQLGICHSMERHIGRTNILAISGGRVKRIAETTLSFPVGSGYSVEVEFVEGRDLYSVRRVFARGPKQWIKGEVTHVFAEDLGETAYLASCFVNVEFGSEATQ